MHGHLLVHLLLLLLVVRVVLIDGPRVMVVVRVEVVVVAHGIACSWGRVEVGGAAHVLLQHLGGGVVVVAAGGGGGRRRLGRESWRVR